MSSTTPPTDPLQNLLAEAESELSRRLHEACEAEAHGVTTDSTAEIRRLEDTLLQAVMAAERTIAARRHLQGAQQAGATADGGERSERAEQPAASAVPAAPAASASAIDARDAMPDSESTAVRVFEDESGRRWRAWPVVPDAARANHASSRSLGDFRDGWICFEALDNSGRRRLPGRGRRWSDLPSEELLRLLDQAITVPPRKATLPERDDATPGDSGYDAH